MKITLESLYKDHDNLRRILYLLEQLLVDICRGSYQDYPLLQSIFVYIQDYPERVHHPAEDAIFSVIFDKGFGDRELRESIKSLMNDHSEIKCVTRDAIAAVETLRVSAQPDFMSVGNELFTLLNRQRAHTLFEEMSIYPYVGVHLRNEDWKKIAALVPDYEDPIFGSKVKKEYELILKAL